MHNKFIILNLKLLQYEQRSLVYHVSSCYERVPRRDGLRLFSSFSLFPFTSHEGKRDRTCAVAPFNFNPLGDKRVKNKKGGVCVGVDTFLRVCRNKMAFLSSPPQGFSEAVGMLNALPQGLLSEMVKMHIEKYNRRVILTYFSSSRKMWLLFFSINLDL